MGSVCVCVSVCPCGDIRPVEAKGKPGSGGLMMAAQQFPLNEPLLTRALMTVLGSEEDGGPRGEAGESTKPLIYVFGPHYSAPQGLNKSILNYIEVQHVIASLQGYKSQNTIFGVF